MKTLTSVVKSEKNKQENQPIFLYQIFDYDGSTDLFLAEHDAAVTFAGQAYDSFPITHDFIGENSKNEIDQLNVRIANVNRVMQAYLEQYDFRGKKVKITLVWANQLADPTAKIEETFFIDSYTADENVVEFSLSSKFDVLDVFLPLGKYLRNNCGWKFKGTECGYAGAESTCNRTLQRCKELSNEQRFGGFPSVPQNRIYVA